MEPKILPNTPEPWLRGTLTELPSVARAVVHALELAKEDLNRWAGGLTDEQLNKSPFGIAPVAFHIRHIARSIDRLLTYAEGRQLTPEQTLLLKSELVPGTCKEDLFKELATSLESSIARVRALSQAELSLPRDVGSKKLSTTLAGLLVHVADHTQRHVGQAVTTSKIVLAYQSEPKNKNLGPMREIRGFQE